MASAEIKCINKLPRESIHEKIQNIGGLDAYGIRWKITQAEAIHRIKSGTEYYVMRGGKKVNVKVAVSRSGNEYIKTEADDYEPNNLLSLPECP